MLDKEAFAISDEFALSHSHVQSIRFETTAQSMRFGGKQGGGERLKEQVEELRRQRGDEEMGEINHQTTHDSILRVIDERKEEVQLVSMAGRQGSL